MSVRLLVDTILSQQTFAVVGVSRDKEKYGYKVYQALKSAGYRVYAINPNTDSVGGDPCYPSLDNVPVQIDCLVTVTPPQVSEEAIHIGGRLRIPLVWMQPGSESTAAINLARSVSMQVVAGGPCILVALATREQRLARAL